MENFDVAIVGAGIIGCSIAFELAAEKLKIVILDRRQPGCEASWAAAGMLSPAPDSPRDFPLVPLAKESLRLYPEFVRAIEEASGKPVDYARKGTLRVFSSPAAETERDAILAQYRQLGLPCEPLSMTEARKLEHVLNPAACAALHLPEEETVAPRLLMDAVLTAATNRGVAVRPNCEVTSLTLDRHRCTGLISRVHCIRAGHVIVAAGCYSAELGGKTETGYLSLPQIPTQPVRGQMLALRRQGAALRQVLRSEKGYLVPRSDGRIVAGSTLEHAGFDKKVTASGVRQIIESALELCPALAEAEILESWCGLRPGTPDDLPILGPTQAEGLILATGHYRNGILLAPVTAKLVREWLIHERATFDTQAFSPLRFEPAKSESARI